MVSWIPPNPDGYGELLVRGPPARYPKRVTATLPPPLQFLLLLLVGWVSREQQAVILYLQAENVTLREQLGPSACASRSGSADAWPSAARRGSARTPTAPGCSSSAATSSTRARASCGTRPHLTLDRDPLYSSAFKDLLESAGVSVVTLPRRGAVAGRSSVTTST